MTDYAAWIGVGISAVALGISLWTRLTLGRRTRLDAINDVLNYWETGSRLRNLTNATDPFERGLAKSVKAWRDVCQAGIKVLRPGVQRNMIREGQKAAIPVEIILDRIISGKNISSWSELEKAIEDMQEEIEFQMLALAASVDRSLEPRERERYQ
jgi:hypothetical protein